MKPKKFKVFGIGLSKTGTNSLTKALRIIGFRVVHYPTEMGPKLIRQLRFWDGGTDITVASRFQELDKAFPGSKFIYTFRELDSWLESCRWHHRPERNAPRKAIKIRIKVYGVAAFQEWAFRECWRRHDAAVRNYFKNRPHDLLIMDITKNDGWDKLCPFLGKPIPTSEDGEVREFPWLNKSNKDKKNKESKEKT